MLHRAKFDIWPEINTKHINRAEAECTIFLGAFAKFRKATISFVMSVRPSVRLSASNNSTPTERIFIKSDLNFFSPPKICRQNSSFVVIGQE